MAWVSVTTTPSRMSELHRALNQWHPAGVRGIVVHVPPVQLRTGKPYPASDTFLDALTPAVRALVRVHRCEQDWGPLTKWVGMISALPDAADTDIVLVADDDAVYSAPTFVALADALAQAEAATRAPAAVSGSAQAASYWGVQHLFTKLPRATKRVPLCGGSSLVPVDVCEGFSGIAVRLGTLRTSAFSAISTSLASLDAACWMSDDLVANLVLMELGVSRWQLWPRLQVTILQLADPLHAWDNHPKYQRAATIVADALARSGDKAYRINENPAVVAVQPPWLRSVLL